MKAALAVAIVVLSAPSVARAEAASPGTAPPRDDPDWDPGHRSTSRLPREIDADGPAGSGDGVYGRFDGLFDVAVEAGAAFDDTSAGLAARASAHYLFMAGVYAGYSDALGGKQAESARSVSLGVDLRPAFIPRWSNGLQTGSGFTDLVIDSISLGLGGFFRAPAGGALGDRRGLEFSLGCGLPLAAQVSGPWLGVRGLLRWDDPGAAHAPAAEAVGLATIGWHFMVGGS